MNQPRAPIRLGYRQILPEGTFIPKENPATVISAYYEMPSKYKKDDYRKWIRFFLETVPCHLVFYTEEALVPFINECRAKYTDRTVVIVLPRNEWIANTRFQQKEWDALFRIDPEKEIHASPEVYKVWYEKKEFVRRAIELNPFGHTDFVWTDAGIIRTQELAQLVTAYPSANRIPTDRMMLLNVWPFVRNDEVVGDVNGISFVGGGVDRPRMGGGVIAASTTMWTRFFTLCDETINRYRRAGLFWGKDQTLFKTMVLENKQLFSLIELKPIGPEMWFYSILYLGCSPKLFERLRSEKTNGTKMTYSQLLKI